MICKNCGENNAESFKYCQYCGTLLEAEAAEQAAQTPEAAKDDLDAWLIEDLDDDDDSLLTPDIFAHRGREEAKEAGRGETAETARADGKSPEPEQTAGEKPARRAARICRQCGEEVAEGHRFCGACGARYEEERAPAAAEDDGENNKRAVERPSFVFNSAMPPEQKLARFQARQINDDGTLGDEIRLYEGENVIGRISSPALNSDRFVNPKHVKITCRDDVAIVEDNNSLNGVFLRLSDASAPIFDGDTFRIGEELLNYCHGSSSQPLLKNKTEEDTELIGGKESKGWGYLRVILGAYAEGAVYRLSEETVTIGRTQGDIVFARDGFVSGAHASLEHQDDHAILTDMGSSNGTFLRIKSPLTVTESAHILIGNKLLRIARRPNA